MSAPQPGHGLDALFRPKSIAIFGASDDVTKIGVLMGSLASALVGFLVLRFASRRTA